MRGHGEKITRKQEILVAAMLVEPTLDEAAKRTGLNPATVRRWLKLPEMQRAYTDAKREVVERAIVRLTQACGLAIQTLVGIMQDVEAPASSRVAAARVILERAFQAVMVDELATRLDALETQQKERYETYYTP